VKRGKLRLPLRILTHGQACECTIRVIVAHVQPRFDIMLGTPFCREAQPWRLWDRMTIELPTVARNGAAK
jgi:hypothetical protein